MRCRQNGPRSGARKDGRSRGCRGTLPSGASATVRREPSGSRFPARFDILAGQYTAYLQRQVDKYIDKTRVRDPSDPDDEELLAAFTAEELRDIFAYISILDD